MKNTLLIAMLLSLINSTVGAQSFEKNGLPCTAEICLGDGLEELSKIKWLNAKIELLKYAPLPKMLASNPMVVEGRAKQKEYFKKMFKGDIDTSIPYLDSTKFDNKALVEFSKITAICNGAILYGEFVTESGNPTAVSIAKFANGQDLELQEWRVISITRSFPAAQSTEQIKEVGQQIDSRYAKFDVTKLSIVTKPGDARYTRAGAGFTLRLRTPDLSTNASSISACGGKAKVSID